MRKISVEVLCFCYFFKVPIIGSHYIWQMDILTRNFILVGVGANMSITNLTFLKKLNVISIFSKFNFKFLFCLYFYGDWLVRISCQWVRSHPVLILVPILCIQNTCIKEKNIILITKMCKYIIFIPSEVVLGIVWPRFPVKSWAHVKALS